MVKKTAIVKQKLYEAITQLCELSWMFTVDPKRDFTGMRKLPFHKVISFLLSMEGKSLSTEIPAHFGCTADTAFSSALVQQRGKINAEAFPAADLQRLGLPEG